ncbi:hypothetical protein ACLOJK_021738 [Asimina triloba]
MEVNEATTWPWEQQQMAAQSYEDEVDDTLPEESFKSWGNYTKALSQLGISLKDRILMRSMNETKLNEVRGRSQHEMKQHLLWWDLIWFDIGAVIRAGIFVLIGLEANQDVGPAVVLSCVVSGISAMLDFFVVAGFLQRSV